MSAYSAGSMVHEQYATIDPEQPVEKKRKPTQLQSTIAPTAISETEQTASEGGDSYRRLVGNTFGIRRDLGVVTPPTVFTPPTTQFTPPTTQFTPPGALDPP